MFYGKDVPTTADKPSFPNTTRYINPKFDELFEKGKAARTTEESYRYFAEAEQLVMKDAPVIVLWYDETFKLLSSRVQNYKINPLGYRNLSEVYIQAPKASAKKAQ
jgi:peptide/nickel transport system substrate-binding protein